MKIRCKIQVHFTTVAQNHY